jgi:sialidase-1
MIRATTLATLFLSLCAIAFAASDFKLDYVVIPSTGEYPRNGEGDLIELKDHSLLLVYTRFIKGGGDFDNADIVGRISKDGGKTWGADYVIQVDDAPFNVMSCSLTRMKSGELLLSYLRVNSYSDCRTVVRSSSDEGKTWSPEVLTEQDAGYDVENNDRTVLLSTGRLLLPVAWVPDYGKTQDFKSLCYISDDRGLTWRRGKGLVEVTTGGGAQEPGVVELKDGRLLMVFRSTGGYVGRAFSSDGGETWTPAEMIKELPSPCGPQTLERIPSTGDLLLVWNNNPKAPQGNGERTPQTAAISRDEGKTWENIRDIAAEPKAGYCYTSMTFVDDDVILTYYAPGGLQFTRIPVSWFYGK